MTQRDASIKATQRCPKCGNDRAMLLVRMRPHTQSYDWFCCEKCSWLFSAERLADTAVVNPGVIIWAK